MEPSSAPVSLPGTLGLDGNTPFSALNFQLGWIYSKKPLGPPKAGAHS